MRQAVDRFPSHMRDGQLARVVTWVFVLLMLANALVTETSATVRVVIVGGVLAFLAWEVSQDRWGHWGAIVGVAILVAGLVAQGYMLIWLGLTVLLLVLRVRFGAPVALVALAAFGVFWHRSDEEQLSVLYVGLLMNVLLICLFQLIARTARSLRATCDDLADTAVDDECDRLAVQLNTLIGQTLERVSTGAAQARGSLGSGDGAVRAQLDDVVSLVDRGLDQLHLLSFEPVITDLEDEIATTQTLCRRLSVDFATSTDDVDAAANPIFALLLRESVTNMFKHAEPRRCSLVTRADDGVDVFGFTNDGVCVPDNDPTSGTGQRRWRTAVEEVGGTLEAGPLDGNRYRVFVRIPRGHSHQAVPSDRPAEYEGAHGE